jgi:hypothetical protein
LVRPPMPIGILLPYPPQPRPSRGFFWLYHHREPYLCTPGLGAETDRSNPCVSDLEGSPGATPPGFPLSQVRAFPMRESDSEFGESVFVAIGRKGGLVTAGKRGPERRQEIARLAAQKRWSGRKLRALSSDPDEILICKQNLDRSALAALARKNAEELMMVICGKGFDRAYNPSCPPKRPRGR